jgi:hypothetical protein
MELEPWMLITYMLCGIGFFVFMLTVVSPKYAARRIMRELKGKTGKAVMHEIVLTGIRTLDDEIEVPGPPDEAGKPTVVKTTIGAVVMNAMGTAVVKHIRYTFMGEKGHMSKEMKGMAFDAALQGLPEAMRPMAALLAPMLKKYPLAGGLLAMAQSYMEGQGKTVAKSQSTGLAYGGT